MKYIYLIIIWGSINIPCPYGVEKCIIKHKAADTLSIEYCCDRKYAFDRMYFLREMWKYKWDSVTIDSVKIKTKEEQ